MKRFVCTAAVAALVGLGACGKSEEAKQAEETARQAEQTAKAAEQTAEQAAKGLEQMAKGLGALASGGNGDQKPVDPVSFRDMQALFPELDGWTKEKPTGERMTQPFAYSQAQVRYSKGESNVELKIVDSGFNQLLLTPYAVFMQAGYEKETSTGYEKFVEVAKQPGWEKFNTEGKDGELNAVVGKRFLVTIEGNEIADTKVLHEVAEKIDMGKLAALK
jgi:hypothetical protein